VKPHEVDGLISDKEWQLLNHLAAIVNVGECVVEIGSYHGRSTCALASGSSGKRLVYAIDPHLDDNNFMRFHKNIDAAGLGRYIVPIRQRSDACADLIEKPVSILFIDGLHDFHYALLDFVDYADKVAVGGYVVFHDAAANILPFARESNVRAVFDLEVMSSIHWKNVRRVDSILYAQKGKPSLFEYFIGRRVLMFELGLLRATTNLMSLLVELTPRNKMNFRRMFRMNDRQ
jgi:predicted O-methyltransferase YrrM